MDLSAGMIAALEAGRKRRLLSKQHVFPNTLLSNGRARIDHPAERSRNKVTRNRKKRLAELLVADTLAAQQQFEERNTAILESQLLHPLESVSPTAGAGGGGKTVALTAPIFSSGGRATTATTTTTATASAMSSGPIIADSWAQWQAEQRRSWELARLQEPDDYNHHSATALPCYPSTHAHDNQRSQQQQPKRLDSLSRSLPPLGVPVLAGPNLTTTTTTPLPLSSPTPSKRRHHPGEEKGLEEKRSLANAPVKPTSTSNGAEQQEEEVEKEVAEQGTGDFPKTTQLEAGPIKHVKEERGQEEAQRNLRHQSSSSHRQKRGIRRGSDSSESNNNIRRRSSSSSSSSSRKANADNSPEGKKTAAMEDYRQNENSDNDGGSSQDAADSHNNLKAEQQQQQQQQLKFEQPSSQGPREGWQDKKVDKETEKEEEEEEKEEKEEKEEERRDRRGNDTRLASSPPMKKGHSSSGGNGNGNGNVGGKREWCLRKSEELESTATKKYKNRHQELFSNSSSSSSSSSHVGAVDQLSPGGCSRVVGGDDGAGGEKRRRRRKGRIRKMKEEEEKVGARATKSPSSFLKGPLAVAAEAEAEAERYHRGEVEAAGRGALSKRHHASSVSPSPLLLPHSCRYSLSASQSIEDSLIDAIAAAAIANTAASSTLPPPPPSETRANESAQEAAGVHASPSPPSSAARAVRVAATAAAAVSAAAAAPGKRTPRSFAAVSTRVSEDAGRRLGEGFLDMAEKTSTDRHHYGSSVDGGRGGEEVDGGGGCGGGGAYEKDDGKRVQADGGGGGGGFAGLGLGMDSERPRRRRHPRRTDSAATAWKEKKKKKKKQDEDGGNNTVVGVGSAMVRDLKREYDASQARFARFNALRTTLLTTRDRARERTRQLVVCKALAALRLGLRQWKEWSALQRNVELVVAYRKVRGGRGVGQVLLRLLSRHAKGCFLRWHHACVVKLATAERDRAATVLQASVARGWLLGRRRLLRQGEEAAAVEIQRCVGRGALTRLRVGPLRVGPLKAGAGGDSLSSSSSSSSTPSSSSRWWGGGSNDGGGGCGAYDCTSSGGALEQFEQRLAARAVEEVWWRVQLRREWRIVAKDSQTRQRAVVVQCWWRRFSSVKVVQLKRNALRVHNSAVAVQAKARQLAAKVVVGKVREEKRVCSQVTSVQSLARWKMGKKRALRRRKAWSACILIQKNWRLGLPKRRLGLKRKHKAATKLSAAVRMLQAKSLVGKKRRRQKGWKEPSEADKHASAALVTSSVRVKVAKNAVKKKRAEREVKRGQCATRINGVVRSKKAREVVLGKKQAKASVKIQRKVRGQLATKKVNKVRAKKKAGFWLWVAWHAKFWARRAVAATLHKRFVAETANRGTQATKIQSGYRGLQGRRRGLELKEAKEAVKVFASREKAATSIQVVLRSNQKRQQTACRVASVKRAKEQAERKGQGVLAGAWRQFQARKLASALRSLKRAQSASAVLTRLGRGLLGRSKAKTLKARRAELLRKERWRQLSATAIQAWKRAVFTRRLTRQLLQERRVGIEEAKSQRFYDSAVVIQCLVRCWRARKRLQSRLAVRKKQLEQSRLDHELELELAQLHCKLEETLFAVRLQCFARKSQAVEKMANAREAKEKEREAVLLKRRHNGAAAIQSLAKGRAARKWFRHNAARLLRERNSRQSSRGGRGQGGRGGGGGGGGLDGGLLSVQEPNSSRNTRAPQADGSSSSSSSSKNKRASVGLQGKGKGGSISGSSGGGGDNSVSSHNGFKKLFDDSAKAHYWYNEATQEAQWTDPAGDA